MCLVCWQQPTRHWTEFGDVELSTEGIAGGQSAGDRQRERFARAKVLNEVLRYYGLNVQDWMGALYRLGDQKGNTVLIQDLGELWPAAEKMAGHNIDPLDPSLVTSLTAYQRTD